MHVVYFFHSSFVWELDQKHLIPKREKWTRRVITSRWFSQFEFISDIGKHNIIYSAIVFLRKFETIERSGANTEKEDNKRWFLSNLDTEMYGFTHISRERYEQSYGNGIQIWSFSVWEKTRTPYIFARK